MNRQKILIGLMVLSLGYAVFVLGSEWLGKEKAAPGSKAAAADAQKILANACTLLDKEQLTLLDRYRLESASEGWASSPFYGRMVAESVTGAGLADILPQVVQEKPLVYDGYVDMGGELWAIINGRDYRPGEPVGDTGYVVRRILKFEVVLEKAAAGGSAPEQKILPIAELALH